MFTSLALDALLIVIVLMTVPLGFLRGGLREVSTSAALLLGILMAGQWAERWSDLLIRAFDMTDASAQFVMSIAIVVVITGIVGYGGSASFSWRPGPGGRMYGAYLALLNALLFIGFLINTYIQTIFDGEVPEAIDGAHVAKAVSVGFEWILLVGTVGILGATLFGMLVRERGDDEAFEPQVRPEDLYRVRHEPSRPQVRPLNEPEQQTDQLPTVPAKPVRIREVRHWEEEQPTTPPETTYGSGWRTTWPEDRGGPPRGSGAPGPSSRPATPRRETSSSKPQRDVLRDWMSSEKDTPKDR